MLNHQLIAYGDNAWLVEFGGLADTLTGGRLLSQARPEAVTDIVAGLRTQTVCFDHRRASRREVAAWIAAALAVDAPAASAVGEEVVVPVRYDGDDLPAVASELGLSVAELIERHTGTDWVCAFTGFSPGFGYLVSTGWGLEVPRLATPRAEVPAGAVALAASFSGVYPRSSPGGWRLIGNTDSVLWDLAATPPNRLAPGTRVRFTRG